MPSPTARPVDQPVWRPLADQGDARAQFKLTLVYAEGQGVPQN
jgi:TPR repeat protein